MDLLKIGSFGPNVELLQSVLKSLGFYLGSIDGIFGSKTQIAVKNFQLQFRLPSDGIVGTQTFQSLSPYINGYTIYTVSDGDTLYSISNYFNTNISRILMANQNINSSNVLNSGQKLIIPFENIVRDDISYTYSIMNSNIIALSTIYPFLSVQNVGNSVLGRPLPVIRLGNGSREIFYSASIHANEWITSVLLMRFIENYCLSYTLDTTIFGYNIRQLYTDVSIYIMPMVNPDGVDLVTGSIKENSNTYEYCRNIAKYYPDIPFPSGWKANINGVDLNLQFPAGWNEAKNIKYAQGFTRPAPRDFVGYGPLTQPESLAIYNFTLSHNFDLIIAYHTQGQEIYWDFQNINPPNGYEIGLQFAQVSGYSLEQVPYNSSFAGYKDWFIQNYNRPGFTIEAGLGENPLPISQLSKIYNDNIGILILGAIQK